MLACSRNIEINTNVYQMRLELSCCNMCRYLQKTNGDPKIEVFLYGLLENRDITLSTLQTGNNACVLISRHKVRRERCEIYTHALFSRFTVYIYQWRRKMPKSGGAHKHVIYLPSVKNQYKRAVFGYMVI